MPNKNALALANRYVAELINRAPPTLIDFAGEELSAGDHLAVFRALQRIRERLLADAERLDTL